MDREKYLNLAIEDSADETNDIHKDTENGIFCFRKKNYIIYCEKYNNIGCEGSIKQCIDNFINDTFKPLIKDTNLNIEDIDLKNSLLYIIMYEDDTEITESQGQVYNYYMNGVYSDDHAGSFEQFASRIYEQEEPKNIETKANRSPQKITQKVKSYFDDNFYKDFELQTDAGNWVADKVEFKDKTLRIEWSNDDSNHKILTEIFPNYTNNLLFQLKDNNDIKRRIQAFKVPITEDEIQDFYSRVYLNHLRHFINKEVIKVEPFNKEFVFWEPHKLDYDYSFSAPNRNEIIHDLLNFINIRDEPLLDKFFDEHRLKHKQGYLQTLLNAANKAGIVDFERQGNSIVAKKGKNYRKFLDGKIRRV